jgi:hypothetical protein
MYTGRMETPLLRTKLHIPSIRPGAQRVPRPRLIERLNAGLNRKLTLISAPAGFGKTTCVGEWVNGLEYVEPDATRFFVHADQSGLVGLIRHLHGREFVILSVYRESLGGRNEENVF